MNISKRAIYKMRFIPLLLTFIAAGMMLVPAALFADEPVDLGTTKDFAVLAGETITNTGPTTITGDVGLDPGTDFTGQASVTIIDGAINVDDAVAELAKADLVIAYDDAAGRTPEIIPTELGGNTLTSGTYHSDSGTFEISGVLTLDGQGNPENVFVFQTDSTLITATGSTVTLINNAVFCRVFWKVGSSATLGTDSTFVGHILALTSIQALNGAEVEGQLLARNGSVTLDSNTIINDTCRTGTPTTPNVVPPVSVAAVVTTGGNTTEENAGGETVLEVAALTETISGGQLPETSTPWYTILFSGIAITLISGVVILWIARRKEIKAQNHA